MKRILSFPEVQFFIIFFAVLIGAFYAHQMVSGGLGVTDPATGTTFLALFFVGFLQMLHSLHAREAFVKTEKHFMRMIAHQLRTPTTAIGWTFQELESDAVSAREREHLLRMGGIATRKVMAIIDSITELASLEFGNAECVMKHVDLSALLERLVTDFEPVAKQYNVSLAFHATPETVWVEADEIKLEIALSNIIANAIKYNKDDGTVTVRLRARSHPQHAEVIVEDTGIGMSPSSERRQLFELFYRTQAAELRNPAGTGLGLYLAHSIVHQHRGKIDVASLPGTGSTFTITLPQA